MKRMFRLPVVIVTLLIGWGLMIWMQWTQHLETSFNLIGMPFMMLLMGFLAVLAAQESDGSSD